MSTVFYDHLIDWPKLEKALDSMELDKDQKLILLEEIEHALHSEIMVLIIEHLEPEHHEPFIERFHAAPYDVTHLHFLVSVAKPDIEIAIQKRANQIITDVIIDLE
jgi:hypothetical protein